MNSRRTRGVTLVELMVSVTIGLMLTVVIAQLFLGSRQTFATTDDVSRMQENIRFTQMLLARTIHLAGYKSAPNSVTGTVFAAGTNPALSGADGGGTASDWLGIRYQGSGTGTGLGADGSVYDCLSNPVDAGSFAVSVFTIAPDPTNPNPGHNALFCNGVQMVSDVDNMQIQFGEDTDGDLVANNYVAPGSVTNMNNVVSVRIGLMFSSASDVAKAFPEPTRTYDMLGDASVPPVGPWSDRRMRRVVITTYNLRNRTP